MLRELVLFLVFAVFGLLCVRCCCLLFVYLAVLAKVYLWFRSVVLFVIFVVLGFYLFSCFDVLVYCAS